MNADLFASFFAHVVLLPPMSLFLMIGSGMIVRRWSLRFGRMISALGFILLVVLSTGAGARLLVQPLESLATPYNPTHDRGAQAIVVLTAGRVAGAPEYAGHGIPDYIALARMRYAAKLQHETGLPILVSGGNESEDGVKDSKAAEMARAMQEDFRTPIAWIEGRSENTAENAAFSARILMPAGVQRILLVTDAMHMERAKREFVRNGLGVIAAPTMFFSTGRLKPMDFLPSAEGLRRSYYASYEWMGLAWYLIRDAIGSRRDYLHQ